MIANSDNQTALNNFYGSGIMGSVTSEDVYDDGIRLLCMLLISGNWWAPYSSSNVGPGPIDPPNPPVGGGVDLVEDGWEWEGEGDDYGSSATVNHNNKEVSFVLDRKKENEAQDIYTDARAVVYFEAGDFSGATSITITYTSDKPINIVLIDPDLDIEGAAYEYELSASASPKTVTIQISSFMQPDWADDEGLLAPLSKNKIEGIAVSAVNDNATTNGKITKFEVAGMSGGNGNVAIKLNPVKTKAAKTNSQVSISSGMLNLNIPEENQALVQIVDLRGRLLLAKQISLINGTAKLKLPKSMISNQVIFVNVYGKNTANFSRKMLVK
jgi:hypothetical protein